MAKDLNGVKAPVLADDCQVTLEFGNTYSDGSFHKGIDLITGKASSVIAPCDARVEKADDGFKVGDKSANYGMGNCIYLVTDAGLRLRFHHLACGSLKVKKGDTVKAGKVLATIGNTGNSTGRHLHYDISVAGKVSDGRYVSSQDRTYFDPKPYLLGNKPLTKAGTKSPTKKYKVTASALNVRAEAKLGARIVRVIYKDTVVTVSAKNGDFACIGKNEWVSSLYLKEC